MKEHLSNPLKRVFFALFSVLLFSLPIAASAGSLNVTLTLPPGSYTLPSDMQVWVRAIAVDGDPGDFEQSLQTFSAATDGPESEREVNLTLDDTLNYVLQYDCTSFSFPLPCRQVVPRLYFDSTATNDTVLRESEGEVFEGDQTHTGIVLPIQIGTALTGTVQTPGAVNASEDIDLSIVARSVDTPLTSVLSLPYTITMGSNSVAYEIHVPDDASESWYIGYDCNSVLSAPCGDVLRYGYRKVGAENNTVEDYVNADEIVGGTDQSGLNFRLLNGFSISGTLTAPMAVADAAGLRVFVSAQDRNDPTNNFDDVVNIGQGETSADYFITVSVDETADWVVSYSCDPNASPVECAEYLQQGYYNDGVMVEGNNQVDMPLAGGESHTNIDLTMLTGPTLSGTLVLSDGVAPAGGLNFTVRAFDTAGSAASFSSNVTIPEGNTEVAYAINVGGDVQNEYRLSYNCNEGITVSCENLVDEGFYDALTETTVYVLEEANSIANEGGDAMGLILTVDSEGLLPDDMCVAVQIEGGEVAVFCL